MQALSLAEAHVGWHFRSVAVPGSVTEVLAIRHMPPTSIDPPLRDYVSGKPLKPRRLSCNVARAANYRDRCGPQARYWEPGR
jgi:hypothetical protein